MPYQCLTITEEQGVAFVSINNPPINLLDAKLTYELDQYCAAIETNDQIKVVVFKSADADFFIAHADITLFQAHAKIGSPNPQEKKEALEAQQVLECFQHLRLRLKNWNKITIGQIEGRASGGASEFLQSLDMRFAALGKASFSHPEVSLGFIPCKGGTYELPKLVGRARALEMILGGAFISAETAELYGYINRALIPIALKSFVKRLAIRMASFSDQARIAAKQAVDASLIEGTNALSSDLLNSNPLSFDPLATEQKFFSEVIQSEECQSRLAHFLSNVGQDKEGELSMGTNNKNKRINNIDRFDKETYQ